jgi:DNA invertase Pin-like site-specific DNA recombinase
MSPTSFVAYCRSSSRHQPIGLEIQRQRIEAYASRVEGQILAWYQETRPASTTAADIPKRQPELCRALEHCHRTGATLIVARLDRLSRSTAFFAGLLESGPPILVVEIPQASHFILHIYAAVAEQYRSIISRRLRAAHERARKEGRKLNPKAREAACEGHARRKRRFRPLCRLIEDIRRHRRMSTGDVARILNERGILTQRGVPWTNYNVAQFWYGYHRRWDVSPFRGRLSAGPQKQTKQAMERAERLRARIKRYRREGTTKGWQIAARLDAEGVPTITGVPWSQGLVAILLRRLNARRA